MSSKPEDDQPSKVLLEFLPQMTTETGDEEIKQEPSYYIPSEEELEESEAYEIGSVDPQRLDHLPLVFDEETQSYVLVPQSIDSQVSL